MEFKERLKAARQHAELNQTELAERAGLTQASISDLERGKSKATVFAVQLAAACNVSARWLAEGAGEMLDFSLAQDRSSGSAVSSVSDSTEAQNDAFRQGKAVTAQASPRSRLVLEKIADAADAGYLTEDDMLLLETIASRIAAKPQPSKE